MIQVEDREQIRRAYFVDGKSIRQIAKELGHSRPTVRQAIEAAEPSTYTLSMPRAAPVLGPYKAAIDRLLEENKRLPRKQRYTSHKMYESIHAQGYAGSESTVRGYVGQQRRNLKRQVYLPLEFDPGTDAQVDWGEGEVILASEQVTAQLFLMRLCYSRRVFARAYPAQKQEAFFDGHVQAFHHFQGVPCRITYDNLKTAVLRVPQGHTRQEQQAFIVFRSHYLFESYFCMPGEGHEKGGVEHSVGFDRRNFLVPLPTVNSFDELNAHLLACCLADDQRQVTGQPSTIGEAWKQEQPLLRPLPAHDYECCHSDLVCLNPYSQVTFETNHYSVPTDRAYRELSLKAYPFRVDLWHGEELIASHPRCYGRGQDILDPLHYLPLLEQRPGAFHHVKPLRRWRAEWPPVYEQLLARLQAEKLEGAGVREFIQILNLHRTYSAEHMEQAISLALAACRQGQRVRFYTAAGLVNELTEAQDQHRLPRLFKAALKQHLIVLDELGFIPFSPLGAQLLFQFCSSLNERVALIVTSNLKFADWPQVFGDERLTAALLDRLTHRAHILEFTGESFRFRQRLQREARKKKE